MLLCLTLFVDVGVLMVVYNPVFTCWCVNGYVSYHLQLMIFGYFLCLDAFLYVFTLLPLRVLLALVRLLTLPCCGFR